MPDAKGYNSRAIKQEKFHRSTGKYKRSNVGSLLGSILLLGDITHKGRCEERYKEGWRVERWVEDGNGWKTKRSTG